MKGFTLIELMISIAIVAILASIIVPVIEEHMATERNETHTIGIEIEETGDLQ